MKKWLIVVALLLTSGVSSAQCSAAVVQAFGGTCSVALYNTYVTIGAVADGFVGDVYSADRVQTLMDEQFSMIGSLSSMLEECLRDETGSLSADDKDYLSDAILCLGYLKEEASGLSEFAANGSEEGSMLYSSSRDLAWGKIEELLGIGAEE